MYVPHHGPPTFLWQRTTSVNCWLVREAHVAKKQVIYLTISIIM